MCDLLWGAALRSPCLLPCGDRPSGLAPKRGWTGMAAPIRRIGILTSGGDAPGLNAVIRAVVKTAEVEYGWSVLGIEHGFEGLIGKPRTRTLDGAAVAGLLPR